MLENVQDFQRGEWQGMFKLWQQYQPLCLSLLKKYGGREKEDLLAEIKIIFIQLLLEYDCQSSVPLAGYLKGKLERRVYNYLRKNRQRFFREILLPQVFYWNNLTGNSSTFSFATINWSILTEQQKQVLELIYNQGYSERETAKALQISPSRVNKVKKLALAKLRRGEQT